MNYRYHRLLASALILVLALGLPTYPVEKESCSGYLEQGEQQQCSIDHLLHSPYTVVKNGFDYSSDDVGRAVYDRSVNYHANPLYLLIYPSIALISLLLPMTYNRLKK